MHCEVPSLRLLRAEFALRQCGIQLVADPPWRIVAAIFSTVNNVCHFGTNCATTCKLLIPTTYKGDVGVRGSRSNAPESKRNCRSETEVLTLLRALRAL